MLDLITLGWPWFAGAAALGALTGFVASSRERSAATAPGWVLLALLLTLGAGAGVSAADLLQGRPAVALDIVLAASAAYVCALPIGRALKLLGAARADTAPVAPARPVIVKPVVAFAAEPVAQPVAAPAMPTVEDAPSLEAVAVAAKALGDKAVEMRTRDKSRKSIGARPSTLAAPRGTADDLTRIKGLGPKSVEKLNALGIFHYDQIAGWSRDNAKWIGAEIGVASRVERDNWVAQAQKLAGVSEKSGAASAA